MLDTRMLRYFVAIADAGSIGAAAEALHLAQPSLSQQLRKLERIVGYDLLVRSPRGVTLTERGTALLPLARTAVDAADRFDGTAAELRTPAQRTVRLAVSPNLPHHLLARLMSAAGPAVRIQLVPEPGSDPGRLQALRHGDLDAAIVRGPITVPHWAEATLLISEPLGLMLRSDDALAAERAVTPAALAARRILRFPRAWAPEVWDAHAAGLAEAGIAADPRDISTDVAQTLDLVAAGAVALVSEYWTEHKPGLTWRPIDGTELQLEHLLVMRAGALPELQRAATALTDQT
jgi:DNA-binding transcriptional LysR family regulator